jgi:putative selenium metabolism hydrolase
MQNYSQILKAAESYKSEISRLLRELIAIPGESSGEKEVVLKIKREMEAAGFDRVEIDRMGNIMGFIGHGKHLIAMDAHIDTVGIGNIRNWQYDPYQGYEDEEIIYGRGASDQLGGMASMIAAGRIIKELGLEGDYTLMVVGSVQEEDCDGLCWQYIIRETGIRSEFVVITEPTSCNIYRGQRGRMEIKVTTQGISCHGSAPERGVNAIYKMAPILSELEKLNEKLISHPFLGKGTLTVSEIFHTSPSRCAVADSCTISIDRRLTAGEDKKLALDQIKNLPSAKNSNAEVTMYDYSRPSYTGLTYSTDCYFPTWFIEEDHPVCETLLEAYKELFRSDALLDKWTFSTNGVSIMGMFGIPCIGFGPGHEDQAHAPNEKTWKNELVRAAAMYAAIPLLYTEKYADKMPEKTENLAAE